jgi:hypothetical protein
MKKSVERPLPVAMQTPSGPGGAAIMPGCLTLASTEAGWALVDPRGEVLFRSAGVAGRHQCLKFARDHGAIAVLS